MTVLLNGQALVAGGASFDKGQGALFLLPTPNFAGHNGNRVFTIYSLPYPAEIST